MGATTEPELPGAIARATEGTFRALSRVRGARIFHPDGVGYTAMLRVDRPHAYPGVPLLERPGEHAALIRFSRGAGLPEPLPDVLGLALRLVDLHGPERHQDFLLATSADGPLVHHLLLPGVGGFFGQSFSSLLLYRLGGRVRVVGARATAPFPGGRAGLPDLVAAADGGNLRYQLALAPLARRWTGIGELIVGDRIPDSQTERLKFDPWNTGGGIRPVGPLMGLRRPAYRGSRKGRFAAGHAGK
jgi:hypothetical protein